MAAERFTFLAPAHLIAAIGESSSRKCTTASEYVRQAVIRQLEFDGVDVSTSHLTPASLDWEENT